MDIIRCTPDAKAFQNVASKVMLPFERAHCGQILAKAIIECKINAKYVKNKSKLAKGVKRNAD